MQPVGHWRRSPLPRRKQQPMRLLCAKRQVAYCLIRGAVANITCGHQMTPTGFEPVLQA